MPSTPEVAAQAVAQMVEMGTMKMKLRKPWGRAVMISRW